MVFLRLQGSSSVCGEILSVLLLLLMEGTELTPPCAFGRVSLEELRGASDVVTITRQLGEGMTKPIAMQGNTAVMH